MTDFNSNYPSPLVIRGIMPRSGTVFLGECLALHPAVDAYPNDIWEFTPCRTMPALHAYLDRIPHPRHTDRVKPEEVLKHMGEGWLSYLYQYADRSKRLLLKYPSVEALSDFMALWPTARIVAIVRDGRDVVASGLKAGFVAPPPFRLSVKSSWRRLVQPSDFTVLCQRYSAAVDRLLAFERQLNSQTASRYLRVRFEDLHGETEATVRHVLEWADLDPDAYDWAALSALPVKGSSYLRDKTESIDFEQGRQKTNTFNPVGRWQTWSKRHKGIFEREAGNALRELGYG